MSFIHRAVRTISSKNITDVMIMIEQHLSMCCDTVVDLTYY